MCEIHYMRRLDHKPLTPEDFDNFCTIMDEGSVYNADSWGFFNGKNVYKSHKDFFTTIAQDDEAYKKYANNARLLIGHNRLATQGSAKNNNNNHPFESKDYVLVHNGIISNDSSLKNMKELFYKGQTDSIIILEIIQALKDKGKKTLQAIKKTAELLEGSYSVLLYEKATDKTYYFKNDNTTFYWGLIRFYNNKQVLLGSTKADRFKNIYRKPVLIFNEKAYKRLLVEPADSGMIYELTSEGITPVQEFTPKTALLNTFGGYNTGSSWHYTDHNKTNVDYSKMFKNINAAREEIENLTSQKGSTYRVDYTTTPHEIIITMPYAVGDFEQQAVFDYFGNAVMYEASTKSFITDEETLREYFESF